MSTSSELDPEKQKKAITEISRRMLSGWRMTDRICPICSTVLVSDKVSDKFYCCGCEMWAVVEKKTPENAGSAPSTATSSFAQSKPKFAQVDDAALEEFKAADAAEADQHEKNRQTLAKLSAKLQNDLVNVTERNMREVEAKAAALDAHKAPTQAGHFARIDENLDHEDDEDSDDNLSARFAGIRANFIEGVLEQMHKNNPNADAQQLASPEDITKRLQEAQERERKAAEEFLARETNAKQTQTRDAQVSPFSKEENNDDIDMSKFFDTQYLAEDGRVIRASDMTPEQRRKEQELLDRRREEDRRLNCMAEAVRQGATMLATHCPQCGVPQVKRRGAKTAICAPCEEYGPPIPCTEVAPTAASKSSAASSSQSTLSQPVHGSAATQPPRKPSPRGAAEEEEEDEAEEKSHGRGSNALQQMRNNLKALLESERSKVNKGANLYSYNADDNELPSEDDAYLEGDDHFETGSEASLTMSETRRLLESDDLKRQIEERDRKRSKLTSYLSTHIMMAEYCPDCLVPLLKPQARTVEELIREAWNTAPEETKAQYFDFEDFESVLHDDYASECFCSVCGAKWTFTESGTAGVTLVPKAPGNLSFDSSASSSQESSRVRPTPQPSGSSSASASTTSSASAVPEYVSLDELRARHAAVVADATQQSTSSARTTRESDMSQLASSERQHFTSENAARIPQSHGLFEPLTSQSLMEQKLQHDSFSHDYSHSASLADSTMKPSQGVPKASPSLQRITREAKLSIESSLDALRMSLDCVTQRLNLVVARENAITNDALLSQETVKSNDSILQVGWLANQTSQILASLSEAVRMQSNLP